MACEEVLGRVDAATEDGHGCGGLMWVPTEGKLLGFVHVWTEEERERAYVVDRESTGVLESYGAMKWFEVFGERVRGRRVLLEMDSEPVVKALEKGYSPKVEMMMCVEGVLCRSVNLEVVLRVRWIAGVLNAVADRLSHRKIEEAIWIARHQFGADLLLV